MQKRQKMGRTPKDEWTYINFTQNFLKMYPQASHIMLLETWPIEREKYKIIVEELLENLCMPKNHD